jgi:AmmeMemoRadiSam system protein B/AmmeMemoRadiSam system protein A
MKSLGILAAVVLGTAGVILLSLLWPQPGEKTKGTQEKKPEMAVVRKAAAAGSFYPAKREELDNKLTSLLNKATKKTTGSLRILIAPHAGLDYSGETSAFAFKQIEGGDYNKIIVLGPSHYHQFDDAALIADGSWETPLGPVEIDNTLAQKILSPEQKIIADPSVHVEEHSLEVQVIWLKKILANFKIVPILVSQPSEELISALAFRIAQNMDEKTLLVVSSDLSHYPNYETANQVDRQTMEAILSGNRTGFEQKMAELAQKKQPGVETLACGYEALRVGLEVAELLKLDAPQLLKYENSGDVTTNKDRVVGYGAIGFTGGELKFYTPPLSEEAKKEALDIAKQTLTNYVVNKKFPEEIKAVKNSVLLEPLGAFVTLRKDGDLRGCIGEFEPAKPLYKVIQQKTIDAASRDYRFNPVTAEELPKITLEISVMTPRQKISDWHQIRLETDGVVLIQGNRSGTFLPQVAKDTKWNLEEFLSELCSQKAGLPKNCYQNPATEFYTYQAQVFE